MPVTDLTILTPPAVQQIRAGMKDVSILTALVSQDDRFAQALIHAVAVEDRAGASSLVKQAGIKADRVSVMAVGGKTLTGKASGLGKLCINIGKWEFCITVKARLWETVP